jgi:uncharacterized protein (DUF885 family)
MMFPQFFHVALRVLLLSALAALASCAAPPPAAPGAAAANSDTQRLHDLFDASWEGAMRRYPGWATFVGDNRYGDRLEDASPEAEADEFAQARRLLATARSIRREALPATDRASLDIFIHQVQEGGARLVRRVAFGQRLHRTAPQFHRRLVQHRGEW